MIQSEGVVVTLKKIIPALLFFTTIWAGQVQANFLGSTLHSSTKQFVQDVMLYKIEEYYFLCLDSIQKTMKTDSNECKKTIKRLNIISNNIQFGELRDGDAILLLNILKIIKKEVDDAK